MARDAHDATWRALKRIVTVLLANVGTELTADAPAGLNVTAPTADDYYVMPSASAVRRHNERNHFQQVYVFPSSARQRMERTMGPTAKSQPSQFEVTIAVRIAAELGADDYAESGWKTLTRLEREYRRCEALMGAIQDSIDGHIRGPALTGDDITQAFFLDSRSGDETFRRSEDEPGTWGSARWNIMQIINVPTQTS